MKKEQKKRTNTPTVGETGGDSARAGQVGVLPVRPINDTGAGTGRQLGELKKTPFTPGMNSSEGGSYREGQGSLNPVRPGAEDGTGGQGNALQPFTPQQPTPQTRNTPQQPTPGPAATQPGSGQQGGGYEYYEEQTGSGGNGQQPAGGGQPTPGGSQGGDGSGGYYSPYQKEIEDLYEQITGRQPFSYDIDKDAMWQSLKDEYQRMGQKAMRDSMGQAAGLTGGYGSSYGQAVGQEAYDEYLTKLSERAPELYEQALSLYRQEGEDMRDRLALLMEREGQDYDRYIREREYEDEKAEREYQRQKEERDYEDWKEGREYDRRQEQRSYVLSLIRAGYTPTDEDLEAAGLTREEADQMAKLWAAENPDTAYRMGIITAEEYFKMTGQYPPGYTPPSTGGGSSGGGSGGRGGKNSSGGSGAVMGAMAGMQNTPVTGTGGGSQYGEGISAQQFFAIESAIQNAGSPEEAMRQFDKISDRTFGQMSREQIDRLSTAMRKAGA